jgi:hypothetical protein
MELLAIILVSAAVLLALCDRMPSVLGMLGTTEVGETSSSDEASSSFTRLLERGGLVERGTGVCGIATEPTLSRLNSRSNLPTIHKGGQRIRQILIRKAKQIR